MDFISSFIVPIVRFFWEMLASWLLCAGLGGFLAGLAMLDAGVFPLPVFIGWSIGCAFLVWIVEPTRKRYLKWVRVDGDGRGGKV